MEQPEAVLPLLQVVPDRLCREMPKLPQLAPALQCIIALCQRLGFSLCIHPGEHGEQHRQQQPQHGGVLGGHFACQIHIILRMEQCVRQRNFLHRIVWPTNPDPRLRQQVKFDFLHPFPPFGNISRFHGHNKVPCPQAGQSGFHPAAGSVLRAAAATAATPQGGCGYPLPTPG